MNLPDRDRLEVVNGPEDGLVFPITRTPLTIGAGADCAVFLNFDCEVRPMHARATVVSGGYRIRGISGAPVFVNGKRSGMVWARIARSGDIIRIGDTSLCLVCVADGLAGRSIGIPTESNFVWLLRFLVQTLGRTLLLLPRLCFKAVSRINRVLLVTLVLLLLLALSIPGPFQNIFLNLLNGARLFCTGLSGV